MKKCQCIVKLVTAAVITCLSGPGRAAAEENVNKHYLGVAASSLSGIGISYGYSFHPDYMFRICGIYTETGDKNQGTSGHTTDIWWNAGAEVQRFLFTIPSGNITYTGFVLCGGNYWYSKFEDTDNPGDNDLDRKWAAGAAMGLRVVFYGRIALNLEFGYQYGRDIVEETYNTGLAAGAGAHFAF